MTAQEGEQAGEQGAEREGQESERTGVDWIAWAMLASLGLIWGGSFTAVSYAVQELPPLSVAAGRLLVAALVLVPAAFLIGPGGRGPGLPSLSDPVGRRIWAHAAGVAFATNAAPFSLLAWAQTHVTSGLAGVMMAALPLVVLPLSAAFVPGDRMTLGKTAGFVIGFFGVVLLIGVGALGELGQGGDIVVLAQVACLLATCGYATGSVITKLSPPVHAVSFGAAALGLAALMQLPVALIVEAPFAAPWTPGAMLAIVFLGLLPTALAIVILFALVRRTRPSFVGLVNYQVPIWAMIFGALFLGEAVPDRVLPALGLILGGVAISQGALPALLRRLRAAPSA